jgi:hypothetical protein
MGPAGHAPHAGAPSLAALLVGLIHGQGGRRPRLFSFAPESRGRPSSTPVRAGVGRRPSFDGNSPLPTWIDPGQLDSCAPPATVKMLIFSFPTSNSISWLASAGGNRLGDEGGVCVLACN